MSILDGICLNQLRVMPKCHQRFCSDRIPVEGNSHQLAVDPYSFTTAEYRVAESRHQEKKFCQPRSRDRQFYPRSSLGHIDQKAFTTPRPIYGHHSDVKRPLKSNAGRTDSAFVG